MANKRISKCIAMMMTFILLLPVQLLSAASSDNVNSSRTEAAIHESKSDIAGHWAEKDFSEWYEKELIKGYSDGSFKPDQTITRAEFITLINRVFNYVDESSISFSDVNANQYFYTDMKKAAAAGYISGYSDGTVRPNDLISRQEAAVMLFRVFQLQSTASNESALTDVITLPEWSKTAVQTLVHEGYVSGYEDHTFKAGNPITRAEAIRMMNNISGTILSEDGGYSDITARNIVINKANIELKNAVIQGDLYLTEGIGEGDITLENVTVKGSLRVYGGGADSVVIHNSDITQIYVDKKNGKLRIVASGSSKVGKVFVLSGVKLEEAASLTESGFGEVIVEAGAAAQAAVELSGNFEQVEVHSLSEQVVKLLKGLINKMIIGQKTVLHVDEAAEINNIVIQIDGKIKVTGQGKIGGDTGSTAKLDRDRPAAGGGSSAPSQTSSPPATPGPTVSPAPTPTPSPTTNPVFQNVSVHDPSVIKSDGMYYVFGSHLAAAKSEDLLQWQLIDSGVTETNKLFKSAESNVKLELAEALGWAESDTLWAADVIQLADGKFYMYYNACRGDSPLSAMGVAVSDQIEGPYVNKGIFLKSGKGTSADGTAYNGTKHPNVVDPDTFFDKDGKLWMVYGSYSGGIFILEMNPETGFPLEGQGHGKRLMGLNHSRIEAPYIQYNPENDYYYLFVTFGGLDSIGGYNMRVSRSKNPDGPYVDYEGQDMIDAHGPAGSFFDDKAIAPYGVKLFGNFVFSNLNNEQSFPSYGYVSAGHNSTYFDEETGKWFNIFHSRFPLRGEAHEVRVHQMLINEDGWPVVAPHRYSGETIAKAAAADIAGSYHFVNHGKDITKEIKPTVHVKLLEDGSITGAATGTWELTGDYFATLTIDEAAAGSAVQYKGVFIRQWDATQEAYVMAFSALSDKGAAVWGSQFNDISDAEAVANAVRLLHIGDTSQVYSSLNLPIKGVRNETITWTSSNEAVVTAEGVVYRPAAGEGDASVILTATIRIGSESATKSFYVTVIQQAYHPLLDGLVAQYDFEDSLADSTNQTADGLETGAKLGSSHTGAIGYVAGLDGKGKAASFDGSTGILLPQGLLSTNEYSVSMWLNPEALSAVTPAFFGAQSSSSWISLLPQGHEFAGYNTMLWSGEAWFDASTGVKMEVGKWTHIAFTVNHGELKIYLNGEQKYRGEGFPNIFTDKNGVFSLGVNYWDAPYKGLMDEVRIYDMALTAEKIEQLVYGEPDSSVWVNDIQFGMAEKKLAVGTTYLPTTIVLPVNAANKSLIWTSADPGIAAVHPDTGQVTAVSLGTTEIIATAADAGQYHAAYTVTVMDGLIAHYAFEGNLNESTGHASAGTAIGDKIGAAGGNITYTDGKSGHAAVFDGASGVRLPDGLIDGNHYTVSMWLKPVEVNPFTAAFFGASSPDSWISLVPRGPGEAQNTMLWSGSDLGTGWYDATAGLQIAPMEWSHIAFTVDAGTIKVFINGELTFTGASFPKVFKDQYGVFALGVNYWDHPFSGLIDELKIYNTALSENDVAAQYNEGVNG